MNAFTLDYTVRQTCLLREFLIGQGISKRTLTAVKFDGGRILVNQQERNVRYVVQPGDTVTIVFPSERQSEGLIPENGDLSILAEDETILLLNKPPGMSTIPSFQHRTQTLANRVAGKFKREQIPATVHIATRLDKDTSGLVCVAKNRHIHHLLSVQIQQQQFFRKYEAIVEGHLQKRFTTIDQPIGRKPGSIIERMICSSGQRAVTHVNVLECFTINNQPFTHVALSLETGRTHQIRVHMQAIGHPLAGDDLYGGHHTYISRQALHCKEVSFIHPLTQQQVTHFAPLPTDMQVFLER